MTSYSDSSSWCSAASNGDSSRCGAAASIALERGNTSPLELSMMLSLVSDITGNDADADVGVDYDFDYDYDDRFLDGFISEMKLFRIENVKEIPIYRVCSIGYADHF